MSTEYSMVRVENGYIVNREELLSDEPYCDTKVTKFVFIDAESAISWLKDNI